MVERQLATFDDVKFSLDDFVLDNNKTPMIETTEDEEHGVLEVSL